MDASSPTSPELSAVITTYNARSTVAACLHSLRQQTARDRMEIVLVDSSEDDTADIVASEFPEVNLLRFDHRKYCGGARNAGIAAAQSDIIAFIDADCVADEQWAEEIIRAHRTYEHPIIGGTVENANPEDYVGWGYYFSEFGEWMPGAEQREVDEVPGCVMTLKRWAFERYGPFIEGTYCSDSAFHWKLEAVGYRPLFVPSIRIAHTNPGHLGKFLRHEVHHGRNFGTVRSEEQRYSRAQRLVRAAATPALPAVLFTRSVRRAVTRRSNLGHFMRTAPVVLAGQIAWSYGEFLGYVKGKK